MNNIIVCGSRDYTDYESFGYSMFKVLEWTKRIDLIIQGGARGADTMAKLWALKNNIESKTYYADWHMHGKAAGPIRNKLMLDDNKVSMVVAFWDGESPGTYNMINYTISQQIPVVIFPVKFDERLLK